MKNMKVVIYSLIALVFLALSFLIDWISSCKEKSRNLYKKTAKHITADAKHRFGEGALVDEEK